MQELGPRLAVVASGIHHSLDIDTEQLHSLQTIVHGDFKTANLFFSPSAGLWESLLAPNDPTRNLASFFRATPDSHILYRLNLLVPIRCDNITSIRTTLPHGLHVMPKLHFSTTPWQIPNL